MIVFEIMFLMALSVIAVVTIAAVGRPLAEAYAEKVKARHRELGSDTEIALKGRISQLEQELLEVRKHVQQLQETSEFTIKLLESGKSGPAVVEKERSD